ncbi:tetratricopeptide domain protein [Stanieria cyanosphaera PCC 7437]|uniref:Tetratricopeptide domain protein n=1 Tax=Stanieria cyanosphaera (strain ATCC 29371 / PCC 7437) TaxID=111780 RepID=K9XXJ6_STAC7|nr:CHAT domain-containing protein [Stanieria cyanosphaera]AFZ36387.1 tetratricopeptide domain protein [Stanieria cyanosphaera PCC 7437]
MNKPRLTIFSKLWCKVVTYAAAGLFGFVASVSLPVWSNNLPAVTALSTVVLEEKSALALAQLGQQYYNAGKLAEAIDFWQQAADNYARQGGLGEAEALRAREGRLKSLINQAQAYQDLGLNSQAYTTLIKAFGSNETQSEATAINQILTTYTQNQQALSQTTGIGLRSLGDLLRKKGSLEQSKKVLKLSLAAVKNSTEVNATLLSLGNTKRALGNRFRDSWNYEKVTEIIENQSITEALQFYQPAIAAYQQATNSNSPSSLASLQAQMNQFSLLIDLEKWWEQETERRIQSWVQAKQSELNQTGEEFLLQLKSKLTQERQILQPAIETALINLPPSRTSVYTLINYAQCLLQLSEIEKAEIVLNSALTRANQIQDPLATSYTLGYLGKVAQQQRKNQPAVSLTQQALKLAQEQSVTQDVREVVYLWQSQLGKLFKQQNHQSEALLAYAGAYNSLQSLRADLNNNLKDIQFDFRQEIKPVYLELADLLLKSQFTASELNSLRLIDSQRNLINSSNNLELARRVVESLQIAELDNLLADLCLIPTNTSVKIDNLDPKAAFIYPVILPNRLEIILSLPGESLRQVTVPVTEQQVNNVIAELYDNLDNPSIDNSARNIFYTSNPTPQEIQANLETLLPLLEQLNDWLIEPINNLLQTKQIKRLIFAGNTSFEQIPLAALYDGRKYLIERYGVGLVPSLQLINPTQLDREKLSIFAGGVSQSLSTKTEIFPSLPNVPQELKDIQRLFPNTKILLNQNLTTQALEKRLQENFTIVHLATHGLFSSQPEQSFILTGDGQPFTIEKLGQLLSQQRNITPQLLVLSACETATGDERAILGLAGVAVRSGASSTLATLWSVRDSSTAELMQQFYQNLKNPQQTRLDALQTAQLSLLNSLRQKPPVQELQSLPPHPYYWAAYVLVGNWL